MKDITEMERKARLAISTLFFILISQVVSSQTKVIPIEYQVINDFFSGNKEVYLYDTSTYDKGWAEYFTSANFEDIKKKADIPFTVDHKTMQEILTPEIYRNISRSILNSKPIKWNPKYLDKHISLKKDYDSKEALKDNVLRLSMPIISGDIAVMKKPGMYECPIFFLKKNKNKWEVIYTFYDWLILH